MRSSQLRPVMAKNKEDQPVKHRERGSYGIH
jgi:hypothetical protein